MTHFSDKLNSLHQAVQLTQNMLAMAKQKQWNELPEIDKKKANTVAVDISFR